MMTTRVSAIVLAACLGTIGCTTYNPATGQYETDPVGTSLVAGGLGMAGGVALGAALSDHDDCCWGGYGYHGGNVNVHNQYNRNVNYNRNVDYNKNVNRNRTNVRTGGSGGGGWGGGGGRGRGGGGRGGGGGRRR